MPTGIHHDRAPHAHPLPVPRVDLYEKDRRRLGDRRFTYAEFGERVERLAFGLLSEGVVPGDRVAYLSFNTHQLLEGYFAAPLVRAIVHAAQRAPHRRRIDRHPQPRRAARRGLRGRFRAAGRTVTPGLPRRAALGRNPATPYEELLARGRIQRPDIFTFDENEIAELFYTPAPPARRRASRCRTAPSTCTCSPCSATFYNDETRSNCTPSRCSTPTAGAARSAPPFTGSNR